MMNPSPQPFPPYVEDTKVYGGGVEKILYAPLPQSIAGMCPHGPWEDITPEVTPNPLRQTLGLVTQEELAAALGVKEETLTVWRGAGTGPAHVKLGKRVFYRLQDLDFWVGTKFPETHAKPLPMQPLAGVDDADPEVAGETPDEKVRAEIDQYKTNIKDAQASLTAQIANL